MKQFPILSIPKTQRGVIAPEEDESRISVPHCTIHRAIMGESMEQFATLGIPEAQLSSEVSGILAPREDAAPVAIPHRIDDLVLMGENVEQCTCIRIPDLNVTILEIT